MKPKRTGKNDSKEKTEKLPMEDLEKTYAHAKTGYENAQEIIKFVDTKTTFLTGASTLTIGFILEAVKQYFQLPVELKSHFEIHPYLVVILGAMAVLSLFAGCLCVWCCVLCLVSRPPKKDMNFYPTVLFPFYEGKSDELACCAKVSEGMTIQDSLKEYKIQIWNVGLILRRKVFRHRWAVWMFLLQLILLTAGGMLALFCLQMG